MLQTTIGKVDEVLGPINQVYFTIKPQEGIVASSFKAGDRFYIGGDKLLPLEKYLQHTIGCTSRLQTNDATDSYRNQSRCLALLNQSVQVVDLEVDPCEAGEGELEVVVGGLQEGEAALAIGVEGVVEEVAQEEAVLVLEGVEVEVVTPISQGLAHEVVDHSMQVWRCDGWISCRGANTQG